MLAWVTAAAAVLTLAGCGNGSDVTPAATGTPAATETPAATQTITATLSEDSGLGEYIPRSELLRCLYYDDREFCEYEEKSVIYETGGEPLCGVAPHHLAAGHFIAGLYRTAAEKREKTDTVVLIAPMHYDGRNTLITSAKGWDTAFGAADCDTELAGIFTDELGAVEDDEMVQYDHSASSHIPFIKRYLPGAKVVCLLVSPKEPPDISERIAQVLGKIAETRNCFFAFSIDFSHYLDPDEADRHDAQTLEAVLAGDTGRIARFTNANVDTPYCLNAFIRLSGELGGRIKRADNSNTLRVGELPYDRTLFPEGVTSYFVFIASAA